MSTREQFYRRREFLGDGNAVRLAINQTCNLGAGAALDEFGIT
ncbi:hypothetical protein ABH905_004321 [Pseudomonas frederiksbergensis]